jgi:hypothetical protein
MTPPIGLAAYAKALEAALEENKRLTLEIRGLVEVVGKMARYGPDPYLASQLGIAEAENARLRREVTAHQEALAHLVAFERDALTGLEINPDRPGSVQERS